ncbi:MAG: 23S rRNA (uracil(1939)-C(5))-methyltransferase RlmD [Bacteroidaceae bacterium]|nr:23S rRNA (uracil(1939)-C(5))-methyltransferase RlmD [Bacteroidaceae bacterium]
MARKKKELPLLEGIEITDVAAEGKAMVRVDDLVVFVPYVVPGDVVDLQLTRKKHSYAEATAVAFHRMSPHRVEPVCRHFGVCGGCKWQCLSYEEQLRWKQKQVMDNLTRIGKVELPRVSPILGSDRTLEYRNKLEFGFSNKRWLTREEIESGATYEHPEAVGFHTSGSFDKILPIDECRLMDDVNNLLRNGIRDYAYRHGLTFYDQREHTGLLRGMMIRLSNTGELMLLLQFCIMTGEQRLQAMELMEWIHSTFSQVTSLLWVDNQKYNDTFGDLPVHCYSGTDHIYLRMGTLRFKVGPKSFYQTNTEQAHILYNVVRDFVYGATEDTEGTEKTGDIENTGGAGRPLVYDLYTGTGTIANFVADGARSVVGIEYVPEAIEDARVNSQINGIQNTAFFAGDMKDILTTDFIRRHGRPDVIITDPPRAGMHKDVVDVILQAAPQRIVYVSCNPATQARDLQLLDPDYRVSRVQPVDMFPHTQHVENVVLLLRRTDLGGDDN